jgi:glycosyltransferase involved in cell wall biosynthesis
MTVISAIITGHREGILAGPSIHSACAAVNFAKEQGSLDVEVIAVLDKPDDLTRAMFEEANIPGLRTVVVNEGDPGQARNRGVENARGQYIAFLDADDLWSQNWLLAAWQFVRERPAEVIAHSEFNVIFGNLRGIWWHVDSEGPMFDPSYLFWANYWDALIFAARDICLQHPFVRNDLDAGYGHEDWHWNCITVAAGLLHKPIPGTVHFKRRRANSQMEKCEVRDVVVRPDAIDALAKKFAAKAG